MARQKGSRTGRCQGCNHPEQVRIERLLAAGASIKGTARKFTIDYHALRRHWVNHVSTDARAAYIAGAGATKDQLEAIVADESLALVDHYRIVRGGLYRGFGAASEIGDRSSLAILAGRLHENLRDCGRLTGELREMRCRHAEMVAVGEHRESDTTITVWDDEKSAWRSIPLARLTELRIDGRAARGRTLKSVPETE